MTREEIISKLKEDKKQGINYKWIAAQIGVSVEQLYQWVYRSSPICVAAALEKYYTKESENR